MNLRTYSGEQIAVLGCLQVNVKVRKQLCGSWKRPQPLGSGLVELDWKSINLIQASSLDHVLQRHKAVFQNMVWHWKTKQQAAFLESKQLLTSSRLLIHFNPKFSSL